MRASLRAVPMKRRETNRIDKSHANYVRAEAPSLWSENAPAPASRQIDTAPALLHFPGKRMNVVPFRHMSRAAFPRNARIGSQMPQT
ncbi:hypothetical protein HW509_09390 [Asaia spathodeae]|uniref:hypothetical protein n=1 Tax=Asaia spathodeae TaxID=657016 RepID=UPI002FC3A038